MMHSSRLVRCFLALLAGLTMVNTTAAQDGVTVQEAGKPFARYPDRSALYLKRLHGLDAPEPRSGELSYRADYPGGFAAWRRDARQKLVELLGLDRMKRDAGDHRPVVELGEPIQEDGYQRQRGSIETEPGVTIPFWLLTPREHGTTPRPLAICAHGHDGNGWNTYAGVYGSDSHRQTTLAKHGNPGVQAVKRGFITLVPATRGLAAAASLPDLKGRHGKRTCRAQLIHCLLAGRTAVGERVWDTRRLLDWALAELPQVDPKRVVLLGNSGGGVLTVYVAAVDDRVTVAVPCCSFSSYTSTSGYIFHCDCCLVPRAQVELGDMSDVGALAAPRALLSVHGRKDTLHTFTDVEAAMARVHTIYTAAGAADRFEHAWGPAGHKFYPDIMWPFIESALAK